MILPTISSNVLEALTISPKSSCMSLGQLPRSLISLERPTIAFKGVLISWDILDRKSDLALFAFSASFLASSNWLTIFKSGFSMVKYIITQIKVSTYVIIKISGCDDWISIAIEPIIKNKYTGINFLVFNFL